MSGQTERDDWKFYTSTFTFCVLSTEEAKGGSLYMKEHKEDAGTDLEDSWGCNSRPAAISDRRVCTNF